VNSVIKNNGASHILLDAGCFLSSNASLEQNKKLIQLMNQTGYSVATIGRTELAKGEANLASLITNMNFKLVNCNYDFNIDVIISNLNKKMKGVQMVVRNKMKHEVIISRAGSGGTTLGKLVFKFNEEGKKQNLQCKNFIPGSAINNSFSSEYRKLIA